MEFEDDLREYLVKLKQKKEVILCGDLNVAHEDIDLANPQQNQFHPGFSREERDKFSLLCQVALQILLGIYILKR